MENKFDLIVIGAGPGGYVAAIKAAKLGLKTAVVENREVGGTCLNRGCIPAKAMIHASSLYREIQESERFGITAPTVSYDYGKILAYKEDTSRKLSQGVEQLFQGNGVTLLNGVGTLEKTGAVTVTSGGETTSFYADNVILATGSKPLCIPIQGKDLPHVVTSDELFRLEKVPESLLIIGGGVIGVEFATVFEALGSKVTIVEALPRIIANMDKEFSQNLKMILKKRGIDIHTSATVLRLEQDGDQLACVFSEKDAEQSISAEYVLMAVGRCPNTDGLFGDGVELEMERGRVVVDAAFQTSMDYVYAIGDLIKGVQLAHAASAQGICLAERLAGVDATVDLSVVPGCVYTNPEIASVGMTEEEAKVQNIPVKTGKFIMSANGKSLITMEERGFVKVVAHAETEEVLGAQMMCARATDMIGEFGTAVANRLTVHQMLKGMRAHPTYNEAVGEALEAIAGGAIHVMPKKR
ncbi:dihydrolipoyl dehydrogenase [Hespellia stercorisuis]|uniref:Dihydrolipoyl dehydrogenase n=1 Tax=Hespellia stercorisuis DSM 15480 TaxID=1121950 RepID=A0A1M6MLY7_9FIRM|nr:dihydrolipoyl dehydrogenase [Hespellia stercorisuis]SHJ84390.1 dihydrolipoamide dehydrogenase [Hespellia stercorisuis DSM 15480]